MAANDETVGAFFARLRAQKHDQRRKERLELLRELEEHVASIAARLPTMYPYESVRARVQKDSELWARTPEVVKKNHTRQQLRTWFDERDADYARTAIYRDLRPVFEFVESPLMPATSNSDSSPIRSASNVRIFVDEIDSFDRIRSVDRDAVSERLTNGRIDLLEDEVQQAIESILAVPFHKKDSGGETNDLYTPNLIIKGQQVQTAFALKGRGCRSLELQIGDCGKNGDQLVRLFDSPATLFVVQFVGPISEAVIKDLDAKVRARRSEQREASFCTIDGQDTARLLHAYGMLPAR